MSVSSRARPGFAAIVPTCADSYLTVPVPVREPVEQQEHRLRLLLRVHLAVHEFGSRRTRHDVYHRTWERHCEPPFFAISKHYCGLCVVALSLLFAVVAVCRSGGHNERRTCCDFVAVLQVCRAIEAVAGRLVDKEVESLFADMGKAWDHLVADPQLRWCVPSSFSSSVSVSVSVLAALTLSSHATGCRRHLGSVPRRASFTLLLAPWTTPFGICTLGPARSLSGNCSWT
jgi:hypothetical protein